MSIETKAIKWRDAKYLINEGDILLFRAKRYPSIGWIISGITGGIHGHVGVASTQKEEPTIIEMREFHGGKESPIRENLTSAGIDVYRFSPAIVVWENDQWVSKQFTHATSHCMTETARTIIGKRYGWWNIFRIYMSYTPFLRMMFRRKTGRDDSISKAFVCSTVANYSARMCYTDPCPNIPDNRVTPADLAGSAILHYLFTIVPD